MALKRLSITALLAGALVGLSFTAARADEPMTADNDPGRRTGGAE